MSRFAVGLIVCCLSACSHSRDADLPDAGPETQAANPVPPSAEDRTTRVPEGDVPEGDVLDRVMRDAREKIARSGRPEPELPDDARPAPRAVTEDQRQRAAALLDAMKRGDDAAMASPETPAPVDTPAPSDTPAPESLPVETPAPTRNYRLPDALADGLARRDTGSLEVREVDGAKARVHHGRYEVTGGGRMVVEVIDFGTDRQVLTAREGRWQTEEKTEGTRTAGATRIAEQPAFERFDLGTSTGLVEVSVDRRYLVRVTGNSLVPRALRSLADELVRGLTR